MMITKLLPQVRFLVAWGRYRKGAIIRPGSRMELDILLRTIWYGMRIAELVEEPTVERPPPLPTPAPVPAVANVEPPPSIETEPNPEPQPQRWTKGKGKKV